MKNVIFKLLLIGCMSASVVQCSQSSSSSSAQAFSAAAKINVAAPASAAAAAAMGASAPQVPNQGVPQDNPNPQSRSLRLGTRYLYCAGYYDNGMGIQRFQHFSGNDLVATTGGVLMKGELLIYNTFTNRPTEISVFNPPANMTLAQLEKFVGFEISAIADFIPKSYDLCESEKEKLIYEGQLPKVIYRLQGHTVKSLPKSTTCAQLLSLDKFEGAETEEYYTKVRPGSAEEKALKEKGAIRAIASNKNLNINALRLYLKSDSSCPVFIKK